jgi:hypothetical protein
MDAKGSITGEKGNEASQTVTTSLAMATASDSGSIAKETDTDFKHVECGPAQAKHETYRQAGLTEEDAEFLARFTAKEERAIYRKVDFRVVPMLSLLYLISHLDRANIGMLPSGFHSHPRADISSVKAMPRSRVSRRAWA